MCPTYLFWMSKGIEFCKAATGVCWKYGSEYKPFKQLLLLPISWFYCLSCFEERSLAASLVFYNFIAWPHELSCCQMLMHFERDAIRCDFFNVLKNWWSVITYSQENLLPEPSSIHRCELLVFLANSTFMKCRKPCWWKLCAVFSKDKAVKYWISAVFLNLFPPWKSQHQFTINIA